MRVGIKHERIRLLDPASTKRMGTNTRNADHLNKRNWENQVGSVRWISTHRREEETAIPTMAEKHASPVDTPPATTRTKDFRDSPSPLSVRG